MNAFMYYVNRIELIRKRTLMGIIDEKFRQFVIEELADDIAIAHDNGWLTEYQKDKLCEMVDSL